MKTTNYNEHIHVNEYGEFDELCICGGGDFYTVANDNGRWVEIEPVTEWVGWGCVECNRVYGDDGVVVARPETIEWATI